MGRSFEIFEICVPIRNMRPAMAARNMTTANAEAAVRCNFNFLSKKLPSGKRNMENKNPNNIGHKISLPKMLIKTKAIKAISTMASLK